MSSHTDNKLVSNNVVMLTTTNTELNCDESESNTSVETNLMNERKNNCVASVSGVCQENVVADVADVKEIKQSPPQSPPLMLNNPPTSFDTSTMGGLSQSLNLFQNYSGVNNSSHHSNQKSPFLLPAQFYKNLFASAAMLQNSKPNDKLNTSQTPFPRNLLFSCSQKSPGLGSTSDLENEDKSNVLEQKSYAWTGSDPGHVNNNNNSSTQNNNTEAHNNANNTSNNPNSTPTSSTTTSSSGMPVPGGVQGQNPTQGLVHWMSAVMAEHMTSNSHHDPAVGMHYMWNGAVDQCGQHKDIDSYNGWPAPRNPMSMKQGYEAKMSSIDHHNNMQKGLIDDGHHLGQSQMPSASIYGAANALRSVSSSSNSPGGLHHHPHGPASALLVVPQPINASKMPNGMPNGTGRKYQCKMCPQIFTSKADLQLHTQVHMREAKPYKCSQCSKAFANSSYLSQHTRIHLGIKPYRCEICQRKFTQLSHLQQHIRTHTGDKPYKCRHPGCQKAFSQLSNLQSHSRCHQTDKPYKCNSCYKCFSDEPSLLEHIPKHKESKHLKTHICQYCGKSYTQETYLTKHMQKHAERTDKRPPISSLPAPSTTKNLTLNTPAIPPMTGDHPYWPKVSPDSAANLTEIIQHQQPQQSHEFPLSNQQQNGHNDIQQQSHHRNSSSNNGGPNNSMVEGHHREDVEDLAMSRQNSNNNGHNMNGSGGGQMPPSSTPMSIASSYDTAKTTSNSAFTPINSMPPHLNSLGHHHQLAQRPYLYDAISFPNKNVTQNTGNSFPNQLISLHQIRNYAHQPSGLMSGEHLLSGVTVGPGKDKG